MKEFDKAKTVIAQILSLEKKREQIKKDQKKLATEDIKKKADERLQVYLNYERRFSQAKKIIDRTLKKANSEILKGAGKISGWHLETSAYKVSNRGTFAIGIDAVDFEDTEKHVVLCTVLSVPRRGYLAIYTPYQEIFNDVPKFIKKDQVVVATRREGHFSLAAETADKNGDVAISLDTHNEDFQEVFTDVVSMSLLKLFGVEN